MVSLALELRWHLASLAAPVQLPHFFWTFAVSSSAKMVSSLDSTPARKEPHRDDFCVVLGVDAISISQSRCRSCSIGSLFKDMLFLQMGPNFKLSEAHKPKPVGYAMLRTSFILLQRASQGAAEVTAGILCWWYGFKNRRSVTLIEWPVLNVACRLLQNTTAYWLDV